MGWYNPGEPFDHLTIKNVVAIDITKVFTLGYHFLFHMDYEMLVNNHETTGFDKSLFF